MPQEFLAFITPVAGFFVAIFPARLNYIDKQFDKLLLASKPRKELADKNLQDEIKKKNPDKEKVLSMASEIATYSHIEKDIKIWASANRKQVFLDLIALIFMIALGISAIDNSPLTNYFQLIVTLAFISGVFSSITFFENFIRLHRLKNRNIL